MSPALALASACFGTFTLGWLVGYVTPPMLPRTRPKVTDDRAAVDD